MKINKRKRAIKHRDIAVLLDQDTILLEDGIEMPYISTFDDTKIYAPYNLVRPLWMKEKLGETLSYNNDLKKWRLKKPDRYKSHLTWAGDSLEVNVIRSKAYPEDPKDAIEGLIEYRDWVENNGGTIVGSFSTASKSLLQATLNQPYITPYRGLKEITCVIGGRLLPCKSYRTTFEGDIVQWDLHSAYSRLLGNLRFGGPNSGWIEAKKIWNLDALVEKGYVVYVEAEVKIPSVKLGPLAKRREKSRTRSPLWPGLGFPTNTTMKGIWTYEEICDADSVGCKINKIRVWIHHATGEIYWHKKWYELMQQGKNNSQNSFARYLIKTCANSLWGRYAMLPGESRVRWRENGKRISEKRNPRISLGNQCLELADSLTGKVRSSILRFAISSNDNLIQGNTDGAWRYNIAGWKPPNNDWRIKKRAFRIDVVDDRTYRYWAPGEGNPEYVIPGYPIEDDEEEYFERIFYGKDDDKIKRGKNAKTKVL